MWLKTAGIASLAADQEQIVVQKECDEENKPYEGFGVINPTGSTLNVSVHEVKSPTTTPQTLNIIAVQIMVYYVLLKSFSLIC